MIQLFQVGVGSGGMVVLDLLCRDERVRKITLIDPDVYQPHNVHRHYFPAASMGRFKVDLAAEWIGRFRSDIEIEAMPLAVEAPESAVAAASATFGICAVDVESAKFRFDALMRQHGKSWTMGEVLSGGIGGWVHRFVPGGACYGCVASHLQRTMETDRTPAPDYADPQAAVPAARIPATKTAINVIAALHAQATLDLMDGIDPGFSSVLMPLRQVEGIFADAMKPYRFRIARFPECLICGAAAMAVPAGEDLDVALDQALARLGHE